MTEIEKRRNAKRREKYRNDPMYREARKKEAKERYYKEKEREKSKDEIIKNKERLKENTKRYEESHKDKVKVWKHNYYVRNKERIRDYQRCYRKTFAPIIAFRNKLKQQNLTKKEIEELVRQYKEEISAPSV